MFNNFADRYLLLFFIVASVMVGCDDKTIYSEYHTLPLSGWDADSILVFNVEIQDTISEYDIIVDVRHTTAYQYQNMWLFVNTDTIDFYLADRRGQWLGSGGGELREMPVLYKQKVRFHTVGTYTYTIRQAMRNKHLSGVRDVGLIIEKHQP